MIMRQPRTWFVIADGGRARIVEPREERSLFRTLREIESVDIHHRSHDIGSDRPGRAQESATTGGHAVEPREDIHKAAKQDFARQVADILNTGAARDEFDRLVLVAPAMILNEIRSHLDATTAPRVTAELQRDLTKVPDAELKEHLEALTA
jgi:protein required for attachment to host cells